MVFVWWPTFCCNHTGSIKQEAVLQATMLPGAREWLGFMRSFLDLQRCIALDGVDYSSSALQLAQQPLVSTEAEFLRAHGCAFHFGSVGHRAAKTVPLKFGAKGLLLYLTNTL